ncbi:uncharacterized protein DFL_003847 [Arthrobotrys flagrans]|uniref:Uncharacterized protein n=1 Tax=Arthrobotrys flagrans TaxID=97331 RepID=A0A437A305_ARTFL|nr:hypothetical protein DFL_003847 [Arthrobotrys flagrans]
MEVDSQSPAPALGAPASYLTTPPTKKMDVDRLPPPPLPSIPSLGFVTPAKRENIDYTSITLQPLLPENLRRLEEKAAAVAAGEEDLDEKLPTMDIWQDMDALGAARNMTEKIQYVYKLWEKSLAETRPSKPPLPDAGSGPASRA